MNRSNIKISFIIPVYNVEPFLEEALDSVLAQTTSEPFEIICVDDGSTDRSGKILDRYAERDKRFTVIHQPNAGQAAARNRGLEIASGEYISFLDSDDRFEPKMAELALQKAAENDADIVRFYFRYFGQSNGQAVMPDIDRSGLDKPSEIFKTLFLPGTDIWSRFWKKTFLDQNAIRFRRDYFPWEDLYFNALAAVSRPRLIILDKPLYQYRVWPNSSMRNHGKNIVGFEHLLDSANASLDAFRAAEFPVAVCHALATVKFKYIYASFRNSYCGKPTEREFYERLRLELSGEERACFQAVQKSLPKDARIFYALLPMIFHQNRFVRFVGTTFVHLLVMRLFPVYTFIYWKFH